MQQPDLFTIGTKVGRLEQRLDAVEEALETWRHYLARAAILAGLWLGVIGAGLSRDELAELLALAIKTALSTG
jgi:hypothetical protein